MSPEEIGATIHPNAWCYNSLFDARAAAARYLRAVKGEFAGDAAAHLAEAATFLRTDRSKSTGGAAARPLPLAIAGRAVDSRHAPCAGGCSGRGPGSRANGSRRDRKGARGALSPGPRRRRCAGLPTPSPRPFTAAGAPGASGAGEILLEIGALRRRIRGL